MPLTTCPDCNRQVSDQAPTCPACGRVFKKQKQPPQEGCFLQTLNIGCLVVLGIIVIIIFIIIIASFK